MKIPIRIVPITVNASLFSQWFSDPQEDSSIHTVVRLFSILIFLLQ